MFPTHSVAYTCAGAASARTRAFSAFTALEREKERDTRQINNASASRARAENVSASGADQRSPRKMCFIQRERNSVRRDRSIPIARGPHVRRKRAARRDPRARASPRDRRRFTQPPLDRVCRIALPPPPPFVNSAFQRFRQPLSA